MNVYESTVYRGRYGFVYLRYIAIFFFVLSQLAMYYVILNALEAASEAIIAFDSNDIQGIITAFKSFGLTGQSGTVLGIMRNLGSLVIPLYFIATISFVLNLNRRGIITITQRAAALAVILIAVEFIVYTLMVGTVAILVGQVVEMLKTQYSDVVEAVNEIIKALNSQSSILAVSDVDEAIAIAQDILTMQIIVMLTKNMPSFNIFLDQFLCLLICIFFCTRPKRIKTKAGLVAFRLCGLIPVAYILSAFLLNGLFQIGIVKPNIILLSFFPAKKLPHFLFIGCIVMCNRMFPVRRLKHENGLKYAYIPSKKVFRATPLVFETRAAARRRSLFAALFLGGCLILLSAIDFTLGQVPMLAKWGLGKSYYAALCVPFLFFVDDRKPTRRRDYNMLLIIYFAAILGIIAIYLFY